MQRIVSLLAVAVLCVPLCVAEPAYLRLTSPHFTLVTDAGDHDARQLLDNFEHMRWMFGMLFPKIQLDPPEPMVIVAVHGRKAFEAFEPADYLARGQLHLAGFFLNASDKHYILVRLDAETEHPFDIVYHEYTHLQFRSIESFMPLWLNEGVAQFFQNSDFRQKQVRVGQPSVNDIRFLRQNSLIPLATLFRVDHQSPYYHEQDKGNIFYAESWALTHYLFITDRQKGTNRIGDYLVRVSRHEDSVSAAQAAFGDLKLLQHALDEYVHNGRYMELVLDASAAKVDAAAYRAAPISAAEFAAQRADVLAHLGRTDEARTQLEALAASSPSLPLVYEGLGFLAWRGGDISAALGHYRRAIQLGSIDFFTYFNTANLLQSDERDQAEVAADLLRATQLNPSFAPAFDELAQTYARTDKLDQAVAMSQKAIQLTPTDFYYRLHAGDIQLRLNHLDAAENTFRLARNFATTTGEFSMLDGRLRQISAMRNAVRVTAADGGSAQAVSEQPQVLTVQAPPRHPAGLATGPRHTVVGVMDHAECSYPAVLDLKLTGQTAAPLRLYANDFTKIDLSSDSGQTTDAVNPCQDFNGRTARIVYAESADKSSDGQIVSIELRK